jgi:hypothetical protein
MNRNELLDMVETGTSIIRSFLSDSDESSYFISSFENWNNNDVVGHIIGWMNYSIDKLSSIKLGTKQSDEYAHVTSLSEINTILYNKMKGKSKEELESNYINTLGNYIKVIALYSNNEINLDTFDTGFKMELWRYMLLDTVTHPVQHVIYQNLKNDKYEEINNIIQKTADIFHQYSSLNDGYKLLEFEIEREEYQKKLKELEKKYSTNKNVRAFVQMNIKENA